MANEDFDSITLRPPRLNDVSQNRSLIDHLLLIELLVSLGKERRFSPPYLGETRRTDVPENPDS
jgi:hypothetical protein